MHPTSRYPFFFAKNVYAPSDALKNNIDGMPSALNFGSYGLVSRLVGPKNSWISTTTMRGDSTVSASQMEDVTVDAVNVQRKDCDVSRPSPRHRVDDFVDVGRCHKVARNDRELLATRGRVVGEERPGALGVVGVALEEHSVEPKVDPFCVGESAMQSREQVSLHSTVYALRPKVMV